jgi:hypothetical protein
LFLLKFVGFWEFPARIWIVCGVSGWNCEFLDNLWVFLDSNLRILPKIDVFSFIYALKSVNIAVCLNSTAFLNQYLRA